MKKNLILGSLLLAGSIVFSQNYMRTDNIKVKRTDEQGVLKFVSFNKNANISLTNSKALLNEALQTDGNNSFELRKTETDVFGSTHETYDQYYKGIKVAYSSFRTHSTNGVITSANGLYSPVNIQTGLNELKTPEQIYQIGLSNLGTNYALPEEFQSLLPKSELMVLPKKMSEIQNDRFAYVFVLVSSNPGNVEKVFIDAVNGDILKKESILIKHSVKETVMTKEQSEYIDNIRQKSLAGRSFDKLTFDVGNADTRYSGTRSINTEFDGSKYILRDDAKHVNTVNFGNQDYLLVALFLAFGSTPEDIVDMAEIYSDTDNNWTTAEFSANKNDGALEAHWAFEQAYDFLKEEYDRDGYDGLNSQVTSFIHTMFFGDGRNAAWLGLEDLGYQGGFMFVGDGDYDPDTGTGQFDILAGLDAISHEFAHGITNAASGLIYERESGALNEGFSDIWGATIEAKKAPEKEKWAIGEDFVMVGPGGLRSMENPKLFMQPDTYMGTYWQDASENCTPSSENDNCGVHTNSGVLNHWYYLLVDGGNGTNDNGYEYNLNGIGIKDAADLIYSVQISYVEQESKYADVRDFTIEEAEIMFGEESEKVVEVKKAWCAVGVTIGEEECTFLGTKELNQSEISIYPNPVSDILYVAGKNSVNKISYSISNMAGQKVIQAELTQGKINVSLLPSGIYILTVKDGSKAQNFKFVKK